MARGVNKATIIGNLGRDPELRYSQGGTAVVNFSLAVGERKKVEGEWTDHTEWINAVAFGKTAENIDKFCGKGDRLYVEGRIQTRKWTDKDGNDRYSTEVVANDVVFLANKEQGGQQRQQTGRQDFPADDGFDPNDDVPF